MMPPSDHTGTPRHFHSSTTSGSACLIKARIWLSILPRQSPSSLILASISTAADLPLCGLLFDDPLFFTPVSPPWSPGMLDNARQRTITPLQRHVARAAAFAAAELAVPSRPPRRRAAPDRNWEKQHESSAQADHAGPVGGRNRRSGPGARLSH